MNFRAASVYSLLAIFFACAAAPAPVTMWTPLVTNAQRVDAAAQRGDWLKAKRLSNDLLATWTIKRPAALTGLKGQAYAESFDSSLKWMNGAISQRDAKNVHQATEFAKRTVHELEERSKPA